jgi:hypothetical protein
MGIDNGRGYVKETMSILFGFSESTIRGEKSADRSIFEKQCRFPSSPAGPLLERPLHESGE